MEMADGIVINKADGANLNRAKVARTQFQNALQLFPMSESGWRPQVLTCSAHEKTGIPEVWDMIEEFIQFTEENKFFEHKRSKQAKYWMYESINEQLKSHFYDDPKIDALLKEKEDKVLNDELSSFIAAKDLLDFYFRKK